MKAWKTRARIFAGFGAAIILLVTALSVFVCFHLQTTAVSWTSTGIPICLVFGAGVAGIARDVRRRLRAERKLREGEERFRGVFEHAPSGMAVHAPDGRFIQVNAAFGRMLGYSESELLATLWPLLVHPGDLEHCRRMVDHLSRVPGGCVEAELRYLHRGGTVVWGQTTMSAVRNFSASLQYVVVHLEDITERRRAEEALRESEQRFRIMADGCPTIMWVTDANCCVRFVNRAYREYFGTTRGEVDGSSWQLLIHPDDAPRYVAAFKRAASERTSFTGEARFRRADGEWRLLASDADVRLSSEGALLGHVGVSTDVTDRMRSEQERQFQHSLIQAIHDVSPDGILVVNDAGVVLSHNRRFLEVWRSPLTSILGSCAMSGSDHSLLARNSRLVKNPEAFLARVRELYANPAADDHCEIDLTDGRILERDSTSLRSRTGQHLERVWFVRDITERKRAGQALEGSEEKFRHLAENIREGAAAPAAGAGRPAQLRVHAEVIANGTAVPELEDTVPGAGAVFDEETLLDRLMQDRDLAAKVMNRFVSDCPSQLENLRRRLDEADGPGARLQAHTLQGGAATVSANGLRAIAAAIEEAGMAGRLDSIGELLPRADEEFNRLKRTVESLEWCR